MNLKYSPLPSGLFAATARHRTGDFAVAAAQVKRPIGTCLLALSLLACASGAQAQTTIFQETFDNGNVTSAGPSLNVPSYIGPTPLSMTYTGAAVWTTQQCDGIVASYSMPPNDANARANCLAGAISPSRVPIYWTDSQNMLLALGGYNNNEPDGATLDSNSPSVERENIGLTGYTSGDPGAPNTILENATPIPFPALPPGGTGRFITFAFTAAAANCSDLGAHPATITINLSGSQIGDQINLCTSAAPNVRTYTVFARPDSVPGGNYSKSIRVATYTPTGTGAAPLVFSTDLTFTMVNQQPSGTGNDWAWDNFTALDVSPSVTKTVDVASNYVGQTKTLTFTVTNTAGDNLQKIGWGFTDTLPGSVVIAPVPNATTTCGAGTTVTAAAGANTVTVANGNLPAGTPGDAATTCTVSVDVISDTAGTFTNTEASYTSSTAVNIPTQSVAMSWVANTLTITKISSNGTGTFDFSGTNGFADQAITTTAAGTPGTAGTQQALTLASTTGTTDVIEAPVADWVVSGTPSCTVAGNALAGTTWIAATQTLTLPALPLQNGAANDVRCTFINTLEAATLQLAKAWSANSRANDQVTIGATTGGSNNTVSFDATAPNAANSGTGVIVRIGDVITLPAESGPAASNYTTTLACTGGHTLSDTNGQQTNTLTITSTNATVCTYTNTLIAPQVSLQKSTTATTLTAGGTIVYTVVASNSGTVVAPNTQVIDPLATGIASQTWTCVASGGAVCPNASGSGALQETIATFPAGSAVTYTITATASANPPAQVTNTATALPPPGGVCAPNNTAPPCASAVTVSVTPPNTPPPAPVKAPINALWMLLLTSSLLAYAAARRLHAKQ